MSSGCTGGRAVAVSREVAVAEARAVTVGVEEQAEGGAEGLVEVLRRLVIGHGQSQRRVAGRPSTTIR